MDTKTKCECENAFCKNCHGEGCSSQAGRTITQYGTRLCDKCARHMPDHYKRLIPKGCHFQEAI